eukprot:2716804-Alexandrium_andersonii.AAC.1
MHPSGALGPNFESVPGHAQFKLRTHDATLNCRKGALRIEAGCSTDGPWADCGLHSGRLAM